MYFFPPEKLSQEKEQKELVKYLSPNTWSLQWQCVKCVYVCVCVHCALKRITNNNLCYNLSISISLESNHFWYTSFSQSWMCLRVCIFVCTWCLCSLIYPASAIDGYILFIYLFYWHEHQYYKRAVFSLISPRYRIVLRGNNFPFWKWNATCAWSFQAIGSASVSVC